MKIILLGGHSTRADDGGAAFYAEVVSGFGNKVNILEVFFAREDLDGQDASFEKDKNLFAQFVPELELSFKQASLENFLVELEWADVVIFRGGDAELLMKRLSTYPGWHENLVGKTIVGSSAGAYMLSAKYIPLREPVEVLDGLGLVDVITVAHYQSDYLHPLGTIENKNFWDKIDEVMEERALEKMYLREGEFIIKNT